MKYGRRFWKYGNSCDVQSWKYHVLLNVEIEINPVNCTFTFDKKDIMKNNPRIFCILILLVTWIASCGPAQRVTSSWKSSDFQGGKQYRKVFIAAITSKQQVKVNLENEMAAAASAKGLQVVRSVDVFPTTFTKEKGPDKDVMLAKIRELGCDLIFTTTLLDKTSEARFVPGSIYAPFPGYGYGFRGYYNYWWPMMYDPGYYTTEKTYSMEGNLFDVESEKLIWSVQTESYNPESIAKFSKGLTAVMMERAMQDLRMK